jgi:TRAP-type C4-dicarboxylate transport system permease small subunit
VIRRALDALYDAAGAAAGLCVFSIFAVMLIAAGARELGFRTGGTDDLVSWMTAAAAFLGLAHTFKHGDFVRVGLFLEKMPPRLRRGFELASLSIGVIFTGFLLWSVALYLYNGWLYNEMSNGLLVVPMWIPQISFLVGVTLLFMAVLDEWFTVLRGEKPRYVAEVEARHARGDFSEDV